MQIYRVIVERTEQIEFDIEARDADDAYNRYLMEGKETGSHLVRTRLQSVGIRDKAGG